MSFKLFQCIKLNWNFFISTALVTVFTLISELHSIFHSLLLHGAILFMISKLSENFSTQVGQSTNLELKRLKNATENNTNGWWLLPSTILVSQLMWQYSQLRQLIYPRISLFRHSSNDLFYWIALVQSMLFSVVVSASEAARNYYTKHMVPFKISSQQTEITFDWSNYIFELKFLCCTPKWAGSIVRTWGGTATKNLA